MVNRAQEELARWSVAWQPIIPDMPHGHEEIARYADRSQNRARIYTAVETYARTVAETHHPEHPVLLAAAQRAREHADHASNAVWDAKGDYHDRLVGHFTDAVPDPDARLTELDQRTTAARDELTRTRARIDQLEQAIHAATREPNPCESDPLHATPSGDHRPAERVEHQRQHGRPDQSCARALVPRPDRPRRRRDPARRRNATNAHAAQRTRSHDRHPPTPDHSKEGRTQYREVIARPSDGTAERLHDTVTVPSPPSRAATYCGATRCTRLASRHATQPSDVSNQRRLMAYRWCDCTARRTRHQLDNREACAHEHVVLATIRDQP